MDISQQVKAGILGQLIGHGLVWGKQVASGTSISDILTGDNLFWAGFQIASEFLSSYATDYSGMNVAGVAVPAGVQVAVLNMYNEKSKETIQSLSRLEVAALMDNPFLAGTLGSVLMKTYA